MKDAAVEAEPVPNMLDFFEALRKELPEAEHVIVSARRRSLRRATNRWLRLHGGVARSIAICFVPYPQAKVRLWKHLARGAQLVIVDDLCYGHENEKPSRHLELIEIAAQTASVYVGYDQISQIVAGSSSVETLARETVKGLRAGGVAAQEPRRSH